MRSLSLLTALSHISLFSLLGTVRTRRRVLAKDSKDNPLNEYNPHKDDTRGSANHVIPGKIPQIIGGYGYKVDSNVLANHGARRLGLHRGSRLLVVEQRATSVSLPRT